MHVDILQALELAGILTVTETDNTVEIVLSVDKAMRTAPTLPAAVRSVQLGKSQRRTLRAVETAGPGLQDVIDEYLRGVMPPPHGMRDTRRASVMRAFKSLHERGLIKVANGFVITCD